MVVAKGLPIESFYLANPDRISEQKLIRYALKFMDELPKACDYVKVEDSPTLWDCKVLLFCNVKDIEAIQQWIIKEALYDPNRNKQ